MKRLRALTVGVMLLGVAVLLISGGPPLLAAPNSGEPVAPPPDPGQSFPSGSFSGLRVLAAEGWETPINISDNPGLSGAPVLGVDSLGTVHAARHDNSPGNWEILSATKAAAGSWHDAHRHPNELRV